MGGPCIVIVGPTGVGKSRLAVQVAAKFGGEIVNADSRQVYRGMDIGTGKPTAAEQASVPHHLYDIVNPDDDFNLAMFKKLAFSSIRDIQERRRLPLLVGGSGLYVWSVVENWKLPEVAPDLAFRQALELRARVEGSPALYEELRSLDPRAAATIAPTNVRRIVRALEVYRAAGPLTDAPRKSPPPFAPLVLGLHVQRAHLYELINTRADKMIELGLVDEVRRLLSKGYGPHLPSMTSVGYREITSYLEGRITLAAAVEQVKSQTHRFARHQYAWFRLTDSRIQWHDPGAGDSTPMAVISAFLQETSRRADNSSMTAG